MIQIGHDHEVDKMQELVDGIARVKSKTGQSAKNYLGFGIDPNIELEYTVNKYGQVCIGEVDEQGRLNGIGMQFKKKDKDIYIGKFKKGSYSTPGKYIIIDYDGEFHLGNSFWKNGAVKSKWTSYCTDGSTEEHDNF